MYTEEEKKLLRDYLKRNLPHNANKLVRDKLVADGYNGGNGRSLAQISHIRNLKCENPAVFKIFTEIAIKNEKQKN